MIDEGCPTIREAMKIWEDGIKYHKEHYVFTKEDEYRFHSMGVAHFARLIASHIEELNPEKAFVLGLLHDYGKKYSERFHGLVGYLELNEMGYPLAAKICLSHTFPKKDFSIEYYPSYPQEDVKISKELLADMEYDDYDRLIQFCDTFFEALSIQKPEERINNIKNRYNLNDDVYYFLLNEAAILKSYFDKKCGQEVYKLLGVGE